jgi:hypothetical protein
VFFLQSQVSNHKTLFLTCGSAAERKGWVAALAGAVQKCLDTEHTHRDGTKHRSVVHAAAATTDAVGSSRGGGGSSSGGGPHKNSSFGSSFGGGGGAYGSGSAAGGGNGSCGTGVVANKSVISKMWGAVPRAPQDMNPLRATHARRPSGP